MKNTIRMDELGVPPFQEISMYWKASHRVWQCWTFTVVPICSMYCTVAISFLHLDDFLMANVGQYSTHGDMEHMGHMGWVLHGFAA